MLELAEFGIAGAVPLSASGETPAATTRVSCGPFADVGARCTLEF